MKKNSFLKSLSLLLSMILLIIYAGIALGEREYSPEQLEFIKKNMMNHYFKLEKKHPDDAQAYLQKIIDKFPNYQYPRLEMAYRLLQQDDNYGALQQFLAAEKIDQVSEPIKMQIVYLFDGLGKKSIAYHRALPLQNSSNEKISHSAQAVVRVLKDQTDVTDTTVIAEKISSEVNLLPIGTAPKSVKQNQKPTAASSTITDTTATSSTATDTTAKTAAKTTKATKTPANVSSTYTQNLTTQKKTAPLFTEYYQLKGKDIVKSKHLLDEILIIEPNNVIAQKEIGYLLLSQKHFESALRHFLLAQQVTPHDENLRLEIAFLYDKLGKKAKAKTEFEKLSLSQDSTIKRTSTMALKNLATGSLDASSIKISNYDAMMNRYYELKEQDTTLAIAQLEKIMQKYPTKVNIQKEMGYLLLSEKRPVDALKHFLIAQQYAPEDYPLAAQIGFVLDGLGRRKEAYKQFEIASQSSDSALAYQSEVALINLAPYTYDVLPDPWFADVYFSPAYITRFRDLIWQLNTRVGRTFGERQQVEVYGIGRGTYDTRSTGGAIPDIFSDNAVILDAGIRYFPLEYVPLYLYAEYGRGYDIIDRNRDRWRKDLRYGAIYSNVWGAPLDWSSTARMTLKPVVDAYGDATYYSRYDDNIIGQLRVRPGVRIFEYHNITANAYMKVNYLFDERGEFFNNVFEYGPGIAIMPHNRFNLVFRIERTRSEYIKRDSPSVNPFGSHYYNTLFLLETYIRI